ncbi:CLUMA_CG004461, isoform A [Clunio marinus]|uniref:Tetraspanin n=1 Tax=Clunio marinus TaxID=568069 RepID=A0A1J1HXA8_9DIPT|nr:CLUMA_CG004461, isoform A [Clunio marinus]
MGSSGYTCIRRTFCCLNVLVMLCGGLFLAMGLWLHLSNQGYATFYPNHLGLSAAPLFMLIGGMSILISFFGCCGSFFESRCCLVIVSHPAVEYFALIIFLFLSEFIVGALVFVFHSGISRAITMDIKDGIVKHYNSTDRGGMIAPSVSAIWDKVQRELQCCGVKSYEDWFYIENWPNQKWVPKSCCRPRHSLSPDLYEGSGYEVEDDCRKKQRPDLWWNHGCAKALQNLLVQKLHVVGIAAIVIAFFQLFGLIISMLLFCTIKHKKKSDTYKSYSPTSDNRQSYLDD